VKENSREEDIKILEEMIENANIENMDMNNCFGGEHIEAIEHILSDYKRVLKENEELKKFHIQDNKHLDFIMQHSIPVQKIKDKIEELEEELEIMKVDNMYGRYKEYGGKTKWERLFATKYGMHDALQELLEGRK
jgi:hypothetical protein